jgi:hypothetical protein
MSCGNRSSRGTVTAESGIAFPINTSRYEQPPENACSKSSSLFYPSFYPSNQKYETTCDYLRSCESLQLPGAGRVSILRIACDQLLALGVNQPLYHCNRPNSFLIKYCQHICAIVLNRKEGWPSSFLLLRILRREIGYNFLETWVAAQRIPGRVQFQVTIA